MLKPTPTSLLLMFLTGITAASWVATRRPPATAPVSRLPTHLLARHTGPIEFDRVPLREAVDLLATRTRSTIVVGWWEMALLEMRPTDTVRAGFGDVSLEKALELLFARGGRVGVWERDGVVYVTSANDDEEPFGTRAYDVHDLLVLFEPGDDPPGVDRNATDRLIGLIMDVVDPDSWRYLSGGSGSIRTIGDVLVVTSSERSRRQLGNFLATLRAGRDAGPAVVHPLRSGIDLLSGGPSTR